MDEHLGQQQSVALAFAQRRNPDRDFADAVVQIVAEIALADQRIEIAVGGADDAQIQWNRRASADALDDAFLQDPQHLRLQGGGHFPDLIEEHRTAIGVLEFAGRALGGAGERALLVTEQLAFEQGVGNRRTVDGHEWQMRALGQAVDRARQKLLARATVAKQQHRGARWRDLLDRATQIAHGIAHSDDAFERHRTGALAQPPVLLLQLPDPEGAAHHDREDPSVEGLVIEIGRAEAHRGDRELAGIVLGHRDDLGVGGDMQNLAQQIQALRRDRRLACRAEIEQHDIRLEAPDQHEGLLGGFGGGHLEVREDRFERGPELPIVLEDQKPAPLRRSRGRDVLRHLPLTPYGAKTAGGNLRGHRMSVAGKRSFCRLRMRVRKHALPGEPRNGCPDWQPVFTAECKESRAVVTGARSHLT